MYKYNRLICNIIILFLFSNPSLAAEVHQYVLQNGMKIVVIPDHKTSGVMHSLWYKVGSADDEPGKSGTAHFLEHLMFKGTKKLKTGAFHYIVSRNGGSYNAFTHFNFTAYYEKVTPEYLEEVMELEADRMRNLILDEREIDLERKVVLEERRMRIDNIPEEQLEERVRSAMYQYHSYSRPIIGWKQDILNINKQSLQKFYNKYYQPNNAILVVSGSVEPEKVHIMAQKCYGSLAKVQKIERNEMGQIGILGNIVLKMNNDLDTKKWIRYYNAPSSSRGGISSSLPLVIAAYILGEGRSSRLYKELVIEKKLVTNVVMEYQPDSYGEDTVFGIHITPNADSELDKISEECDKILHEFVNSGISEQELEKAKNMIVADMIYDQESFYQKAYRYGVALVNGISLEDISSRHEEKLKQVTTEEVINSIAHIIENNIDGYLLSQK